jgi:cytochrome c-type biogenesis protein CcmH
MLFGLFALLTGAAVFAILWPLAGAPRDGAGRSGADVAFYKAKLAEIAREKADALLSPQEAEAARTEAARRLLQAAEVSAPIGQDSKPAPAASLLRTRLVAVLALILVPGVSFGLYALLGHPAWPDDPLAARLNISPQKMSLAAAIAKVEVHLLHDPEDGRGYEVLVPAYLSVGRFDDAVRAASLAMQKLGATPQRVTIYGETLVYAANGIVTEAARKMFEKAAAADPPSPKALYFLGLAAAQDGNKELALAHWQKLLALIPKGEPLSNDVAARIAALNNTAAPAGDEAAAIAAMSPTDRAAAIHSMIDRLAARLEKNGHDIEGWLRLVRAYKVINETDKARAALASARHDFDGDPKALARIDALAHELGLDS